MKQGARKRALVAGVVAAVSASVVAIGAFALEPPQPVITPGKVGGIRLGAGYGKLHKLGFIGKIRQGCELSGPKAKSAPLRAPLKGSVDFSFKTPRKVRYITLTGGATANGVGIGSTTAQIQAAFPGAIVDHNTEPTFGLTLVKVPRAAGGPIQFAVGAKKGAVTLIGVPVIPFCE